MARPKSEKGWQKKYKSQCKYQTENQKAMTLKFHIEKDKDILEYLENAPSKLEAIRHCVRQQILAESKTK